ncbi:MAG: hypothetical protein JXX29_17270 [Deltaproteobacteria bacterium]|nr:hypothetical protein [Deltaproteobacteria bacterium]MBN2673437.1 hypothetical protein [Deltaproteobacteria bacterium]
MWPFRISRKPTLAREFPLYDVHSHLLPGVDDGSTDPATTAAFLAAYADLGYRGIVATPHTNHPMFQTLETSEIDKQVAALSETASPLGISIRSGGEIMLRDSFETQFLDRRLPELGGAYLVELENRPMPVQRVLEPVLYQLQRAGKVLILAHPERYAEVQKNPRILAELKVRGVLFQINLGSLTGWFGARAQELAWRMVQDGIADMAATDVHQLRDFQVVNSALQELEAFSSSVFRRLVSEHPGLVFSGRAQEIESAVGAG